MIAMNAGTTEQLITQMTQMGAQMTQMNDRKACSLIV
jgi:hypothetical protein